MSQWVALMWGIKPESRDAVRELFHGYGRPDHTIKDDDGNEVGTLLQTLVFMKDDQVIRVVETTDGVDLPTLAKHMGRQPAMERNDPRPGTCTLRQDSARPVRSPQRAGPHRPVSFEGDEAASSR